MTEALARRLQAMKEEVVSTQNEVVPFEQAQRNYREARKKPGALYDEALAARPYVAQLEQKVAALEAHPRQRGKW